ncbi:tumor necrosis factor alpha-induced protein 2-like [Anomaloglossus baeobatrachus]
MDNMVYDDVPLDYKTKINTLYEILEKEMFEVILYSLVQVQKNLLIQVVKAIKLRETEDSKIFKNKEDGHNRKTPRKWKEKWMKWIEESVSEQMSKADSYSNNLPEKFLNMEKKNKKWLIPCDRESQQVLPGRVQHMESITKHELNDEDTYSLLRWIQDTYPQRILRDPLIQGHIDESKLQILLPPRTIEQLERTYVECEEDKLETQLEKSLDLEVKRWNDRKEPVQEGRYYLSGLEKDVTKIFIASLKRTAKISETMSCKMAPCLGRKLQDFLTRYHNLVVEYTVTLKKKEKCFWNITIANINSILAFRNLLESKDLRIQGETKETLNHVLHEFETLGYNALLQDLFEKLKPHFKKLQHGKDRKQNCTEIMDNVMSCISSLKHLCQPYYQVMISKIHSQMVLEYVTQVLENPVRLENSIQLKFAAAQMAKNADKIKFYFKRKGSQEIWLDPLLNQLANIIKALNQEDTINEICTLA